MNPSLPKKQIARPLIAKPIKAKGQGAPHYHSLYETEASPLSALEYPGDVEGNATVELETVESFIKEQRQGERERWRLLTDPDFWCCLVFQSREQRDDFLARAGWADIGPKYLNGLAVAHRLGIDIDPIALPRKPVRPMPRPLRGAPIIPKKEG